MPQSLSQSRRIASRATAKGTPQELQRYLAPRHPSDEPLPPRIPSGNAHSAEALDRRVAVLRDRGIDISPLGGPVGRPDPETLAGNIENLVGFAQVPIGVIGPLRVNGLDAHGDYYVPFATTEGALVASYHRGAHVVSQAGGVAALCLTESVSRSPCFAFADLGQAALFAEWALSQDDFFRELVAGTTSHGELQDLRIACAGTLVYLILDYFTGDAAGQNMVTVATDAICAHLVEHSPVPIVSWYVEGNMSGDKKPSMLSFIGARGKKVVASARIGARLIERFLHTTPMQMAQYCRISAIGGIQSGTIGVQGHYANALAALFIACGQDAACVAEASVGITQMEVDAEGALNVSVTLPGVIVGTVGGGTHLPTARACLEMMGCAGNGKARAFAEICAATVLAGEVSIIAALSAGDFARAHATRRHKG